MIGIKQAVQSAVASVGDLYPEANDIRLEEVEPAGDSWSVVVSFKSGDPVKLASVMGVDTRLYKKVQIDPTSGDLVALKVWK